MTAGPVPATPTPTTLYRFYDTHDQLLYVGITDRGARRWNEHRKVQPWWVEVERISTEHYGSRQEALDAERAAIVAEQPRYNVVHNRPEAITATAVIPGRSTRLFAAERLADLRVGTVVAVLTTVDDFPPVGLVKETNDRTILLSLYSWASMHFGLDHRRIEWGDVMRIKVAEEIEPGVFDMDPLSDFQSAYRWAAA